MSRESEQMHADFAAGICPYGTVDYPTELAPCYPWALQAKPMISRAAAAVGEPVTVLMGDNRARKLAQARWAVMLGLRHAGWSTSRIGRALRRDHTTVMSGLERGKALMAHDRDFQRLYAAVAG